MNPETNILNIISIRRGCHHIDPETGEVKVFPSINRAKAESRRLGGAGKVRALKTDAVKEFRKEYLLATYNSQLETIRTKVEGYKIALEAAKKAHEEATDGKDKLLATVNSARDELSAAICAEIDCLAKLSEIRKGIFS